MPAPFSLYHPIGPYIKLSFSRIFRHDPSPRYSGTGDLPAERGALTGSSLLVVPLSPSGWLQAGFSAPREGVGNDSEPLGFPKFR